MQNGWNPSRPARKSGEEPVAASGSIAEAATKKPTERLNKILSLVIALQLQATIAIDSASAQSGSKLQPNEKADLQAKARKGRQAKNDGVVSSMGFHHSDTLPVNFPLPPYPNVKSTSFISTTKGPPSATATMYTTDPPGAVFNFYLDAFNKGKFKVMAHKPKEAAAGKGNNIYILRGIKDRQDLAIFAVQTRKNPGTMISIAWSLRHK